MKKFFSVLFLMALVTSVISLVGCNGLWGFDDDDDVVGPVGTRFSLSGVVEIPGDGIDSNGDGNDNTNLRAVKVSDGLKAEVWKKVAGKADEKVHTGDVNDEGKYALEFYNSPAYYFIKVVKSVDDGKFKLLVVLGSLTEAAASRSDVTVNASSTAVAVLMERAGADTSVDPVEFEAERKADVDLLATELNTALEDAAKGEVAVVDINEVFSATKFPIDTVELNKSTANISVGTNETLTVVASPSYAFKDKEEWSSSNDDIATVVNGVVTPKLPGTVDITYKFYGVASDKAEKIVFDKCTVTVTQPVTSVEISQASLNLFVGNEATLTATVKPENASNQTVSWNSSNANVASVVDGKILAKAVGRAIITVTTQDGNKSVACTVNVAAAPKNVTAVALDPVSIVVGNSSNLTIEYTPPDANTQKTFVWSSSDKTVADVDQNGKVTAAKAGETTITLTVTTDNTADPKTFTATCKVTVTAAPLPSKTSVNLDPQVSHDTDTTKQVTLSEMWIKISGVSTSAFTTTVTLQDTRSNTIVLSKDDDLTSQEGVLTLIAKTVNGAPLDAEVGDFFKKYKAFQAITFSTALPGEATVTVVKFDGQNVITLANEVK